jgi:AcrR family transcriptional regulator
VKHRAHQLAATGSELALLDQGEPSLEADAPGGHERVVGPQPHPLVAGVVDEAQAGVDEPSAEAVATPVGVHQHRSQLGSRAVRVGLVGGDAEDAPGLGDLSLRPLAAAVGSSPRVLLYLFGSKGGLVRALLARARTDELDLLDRLRGRDDASAVTGLTDAAAEIWAWLATVDHRALLTLWVEGYARSLVDPDGPWASFAHSTIDDWLTVLADAQPPAERDSRAGIARRTLVLAVLRGALLDLLATGDVDRTTAAVRQHLSNLTSEFPAI